MSLAYHLFAKGDRRRYLALRASRRACFIARRFFVFLVFFGLFFELTPWLFFTIYMYDWMYVLTLLQRGEKSLSYAFLCESQSKI